MNEQAPSNSKVDRVSADTYIYEQLIFINKMVTNI